MMALLVLLPDRIRLLPHWMIYVIGAAVLAPITGVRLTAGRRSWLIAERAAVLTFVTLVSVGTLVTLASLIGAMIYRSTQTSGLQLLTSSLAIWATNVIIFSLLYWQIDRGGPESRINDIGARPDWLFPQEVAPTKDVPSSWRPSFVDYLYLGYTTATAFSTTDVAPLTARAKLLMMLESAVSLVTMVLVASRAINILGTS
jgi:uncharacterized membrane protein